jgi:hypothetical protein
MDTIVALVLVSLETVSRIKEISARPLMETIFGSEYVRTLRSPKLSNTHKGGKGLPLCFSTATGTEEIMTKYDTGTMGNHISLDLAKKLDYPIDRGPQSRGQFKMANGKTITAVGRIKADIAFLGDKQVNKTTCYFNVFEKLAFPALIGMAFLHATETLSKYTSRLVNLPEDCRRSLRLCAVGEATNQVQCLVNGKAVTAHADTGAEIALISAEYATRNNLVVENGCEELMLADGSIDYTKGFSDVAFSLKSSWMQTSGWDKNTVRFHVLDNLQFDVLLDEDIVEVFELFKDRAYSFIDGMLEIIPSIAAIVHLGRRLEEGIFDARQKVRGWTKGLRASKTQGTPASTGPAQGMTASISTQPSNTDLAQALPTMPMKRELKKIKRSRFNNASTILSRSTTDTGLDQAGSPIRRHKPGGRRRGS